MQNTSEDELIFFLKLVVWLFSCRSYIAVTYDQTLCIYSILKVGVACMDDARYLQHDYNLNCVGCVDLRHLVPRTIPSARTYVESTLAYVV